MKVEPVTTIYALRSTQEHTLPYTLEVCGKQQKENLPEDAVDLLILRSLCGHDATFFSLGSQYGMLFTDLPGRCVPLRRYKAMIEKKYDNDTDMTHKKLIEISMLRAKGIAWVYINEHNEPVVFHGSYIHNIHRPDPVLVKEV